MPTLTLKQYAAHCRASVAKIQRNKIAAERQTIQEGLAAADLLSSGPHSTAELTAKGHPYGRRHPDPAYNAAIINVQTGRFRAAWAGTEPAVVNGSVVCKITNDSPEAAFMAGTRAMIARPIAQAIVDAVQPAREKRLTQAVIDAMKV